MELLRQRIVDSSLLQLIRRFLKSGIMEEGIYFETDQGTPQGGVLSPVLANVYLHYVLDSWFETEVRMNKFGLKISEEKSKIIEFGRCSCQRARKYGFKCETFDFLGFTHFCDKPEKANSSLGGRPHVRSSYRR